MIDVTWGMRFNEHSNYRYLGKVQKLDRSPEWLKSSQTNNWHQQGLIIWNNIDRKLEVLNGTESLKLLSELVSQDVWKSNGVSITRFVHRIELDLPSRKNRKKGEDVQEEIIHLPPEGDTRMISRYQTAEGRIWLIWLAENKFFWNTCVKREGHVGDSHHFVKFAEAVDWVEREIVNLANKPDVKKEEGILSEVEIKANRIRLKAKLINGPYWIDAARMEPQRITYKVLIDLEAKPISYKTFETICGDTYKYAERYTTPVKLAADIHLDAGHFQISQVLGDNSEHFRFTSLTNYYQETSAAEQAQKDWNQSRILQLFKTGEIVRGRFGYQEVETGYITLLGACGQADHVWREEENRGEFMERKALRESLSFALDANDYRDFLGLSAELMSDDRLLESMHETRSDSKIIPDEARRESLVWLAQHKLLD